RGLVVTRGDLGHRRVQQRVLRQLDERVGLGLAVAGLHVRERFDLQNAFGGDAIGRRGAGLGEADSRARHEGDDRGGRPQGGSAGGGDRTSFHGFRLLIDYLSSTSTSVPSGTSRSCCSASLGTRMHPWLV